MKGKRYILKFKDLDKNTISEAKLIKVLSLYHISIVDASLFPKMVLVESSEDLFGILPQDFKNKWHIFPEKTYEIPDTRMLIRSKK
jgi:hypothetical protein